MLDLLIPDVYAQSIYTINYKKEFVKNKQGYLKYLDLNKVKQES